MTTKAALSSKMTVELRATVPYQREPHVLLPVPIIAQPKNDILHRS